MLNFRGGTRPLGSTVGSALGASRNTSTEIPAAKTPKTTKMSHCNWNEIEVLKKEIESMKKSHSVLSQILTRRQLLLYPPSKSTPQKTAV